MNCPKCNKEINDRAKLCGYCGKKIILKVSKPVLSKPTLPPPPKTLVNPASQSTYQSSNVARCSKCGSTSLQVKNKGISTGAAVTGALLIGPLGLLAGTVGMNNTKIVCLKCGNEFYPEK